MSIDYSCVDAVAEIVLNRPDRLNAIDAEHFDALNAALKQAVDDHARVLLISGTGRAFCAGRDIGEIDPLAEDPADVLRSTFNALVMKIVALPMPSVAAVQGACLGAGTGIALACDVVVAADDAKFASPLVAWGRYRLRVPLVPDDPTRSGTGEGHRADRPRADGSTGRLSRPDRPLGAR